MTYIADISDTKMTQLPVYKRWVDSMWDNLVEYLICEIPYIHRIYYTTAGYSIVFNSETAYHWFLLT
jgi:acetone carboxylase gamma subunit